MSTLLRPPGHRGPVIAAGAVLLALGVGLEEARLFDELARGWHLLIVASTCALIFGLGVQYKTEGGKPLASASVLLVTGLLLFVVTLTRVADVLGVDFNGLPAGTFVWTGLLFAGVAAWPARMRNSAACALLAGIALVISVLAAWQWIFDAKSVAPYRVLLLLCAVTAVLVSLVMRGSRPRHSTQLINLAGLCILTIVVTALIADFFFGLSSLFGAANTNADDVLPFFWDLIVLVAGCGLLAYGAVDREPGPVLLGALHLLAFLTVVAGDSHTLKWWPLFLLVLGAATMAFGLRPRAPLPPEPGVPADRPLATRPANTET